MLQLDTTVSVAQQQASCDLEGEAAILNVESGVYYSLTDVGARIWQLLQEPRTVRAIRDIILKEYDVAEQQCEADLVRLLNDMLKAGLVLRCEEK